MTLYFNASDGPVVINDDGVSVGGGEWFRSDLTDRIRTAIADGGVVRINSQTAEKYGYIDLSYDQETADDEDDAETSEDQ